MNLCSGGRGLESHDEVCYEGKFCPVCDAMERGAQMEREKIKEIAALMDEIKKLEEEAADPIQAAAKLEGAQRQSYARP